MTAPEERMWHVLGYITSNETFATQHDGCEVIRRDPAVLAELPEVKALVAAAVMEADRIILEYPWLDEGDTQGLREAIRADHKAALDAYVAEKMREVALRFYDKHMKLVEAKGRNPADYSSKWSFASDAIRAMIEEDKP